MASIMRYSAPTTTACCMTTELADLAAGSNAVGSTLDNSASRFLYADFEFNGGCSGSLGNGGYLSLYLMPAMDGSNYVDGATGLDPAATALVGVIPLQAAAASTANRAILRQVPVPPYSFRPLISNDSGSSALKTVNELRYRLYGVEAY